MNRPDYFVSKLNGKVLNIGCFDSDSYRLMFDSGYENLFGLDLVVENKEMRIVKGDALEMDYENEFDVIIAGELIEHFFYSETKQFLEKCRKALKPNGKLVITTPNKKAWTNRLFHRFDNAKPERYSRHLYLFEADELTKVVEEEGFAVKECFCLPYTSESSPFQSDLVYFVRWFVHWFLPRGLQEQIVVLAEVM